jgi:hypothetical protein
MVGKFIAMLYLGVDAGERCRRIGGPDSYSTAGLRHIGANLFDRASCKPRIWNRVLTDRTSLRACAGAPQPSTRFNPGENS